MAALALLALALAASPPVVAVWDVKPAEGMKQGTAAAVADLVAHELAASGRVKVLVRSDVVALLGYRKYQQMMGCADQACLASAGGSVGADYVLHGTLATLGSQHRVSLVLVDARKGDAVARASEFCAADEDALGPTTRSLVARIAGAFPSSGAASAVVGTDARAAAKVLEAADQLAAQKRHAQAAAAFQDYLRRFPAAEERCRAMASAGGQWERAGKKDVAAGQFAALGTDSRCAEANPNGAALALDKAAALYDVVGRPGDATAMREALVKLPGVTSAEARFRVDGARSRLEVGRELK